VAANLQIPAAWNATPLTKFRAPRVRSDAVSRPALLDRLAHCVEHFPVTLVCAPGGFGKTTLLAQYAARAVGGPAVIWVTLDEDDNERHRLFAALLRALEPLSLAWETSPADLLAHSAGTDSQSRAALAALVNALCTAPVGRIVLVLDDLHRIDRQDVLGLLESLVERLPDHVGLLLGTRMEPSLPLARWRAHGELAEFVPWDLQFSEAETSTLASLRLGRALEPQQVREIWQRMHGWAVGLTVALQAHGRVPRDGASAATLSSDRHLFAYLAQEILGDLPQEVRTFLLECSVLFELSPTACEAVTLRDDAQQMLELLYRRNLFVTATDESMPVLRFHDLFREFLESELERCFPAQVRELHERAGRAETSLARAIAHFVRAECWQDAMRLIAINGEAMLSEGDHAILEQWLDQIPVQTRRQDPKLCHLRGICAWLKWDWLRVRQELEPAIAGLRNEQQTALAIHAMFLQVDALNSSGERELAWQMLDELERLPLDTSGCAQLALQRAWCALPTGDPAAVGAYMMDFLACAERDPAAICPRAADRMHLLCIGLPRVAESFERFYALCELVRGQSAAPWQLASLAIGSWGHFWYGRREPLLPMLERGDALHQHFGSMRLVSERLLQFRALFLAASGRFEAAIRLTRVLIEGLQTTEAAAHRAVWLRAYQHGYARVSWMARDYDTFRSLAPALLAPRVANEWPFMQAAMELVRGQLAILREDWRAAEAALQLSVQLHERFRMPMIYGDPRVTCAYAQLLQGRRSAAWQAFAPVVQEVLDEQALGLLLLEPLHIVDALLDLVPVETRRTAIFEGLFARLSQWRPTSTDTASVAALSPLSALSEREIEVLERVASGLSNKHIARDLSLSLHTVKRHIANILDKLDCASRGQAAALWAGDRQRATGYSQK
jgi:LuxR family transcriptional regulator, maltose regulon positive regulatory protein